MHTHKGAGVVGAHLVTHCYTHPCSPPHTTRQPPTSSCSHPAVMPHLPQPHPPSPPPSRPTSSHPPLPEPVEAPPPRTSASVRCVHTPLPAPPPSFRIMTYNILADQYAGSTHAQTVRGAAQGTLLALAGRDSGRMPRVHAQGACGVGCAPRGASALLLRTHAVCLCRDVPA